MKKVLSILVCVCVLLSAMVFTASAADGTSEIVLTVDSLGLKSQSYTADTATVDGVDFEWIQLGNYDAGIQVRDKDGKTSSFWNTTAFSAPIKEIKLVFNSTKKTYDNSDAEIFSFGNAVDSYTYSTKLSTTADVKEYTITPDAETYTYLHFEHDLGYTMYWDSITIVLAGASEGGDVTPPVEQEPVITTTLVDSPVAGTAYKFGMIQPNVSETDIYYIDGAMNSYYMNTVTDVASAVDVYLEEVEGGYNLYAMVDGAKKYINMVVSGTYVNNKFEDAATTVYTFDAEKKALISIVNDTEYWIGTRNDKSYTAVGPVKVELEGFYCQLYVATVEDVTPPATDDEDVTPPAKDDKDEDKEEQKPQMGFGVVANPVAGTAYKFGMVQGNLNKTLFLTGEMDGFYMATTEKADEAADVYLEETTGGYYIYAMVDGAKKYLGIVEAIGTDGNTHINAVFTDTADSVFTYNDTVKTFVTKVGDKEYGFGTRNDREYTTISPSSTEYTDNFVCQFYGMTVVEDDGNSNGNSTTDNSTTSPSTGNNVGAVVAMAIAAGAVVLYTSKKR